MGAFLFYLIKWAIYLSVFYAVYLLCMRRTTFFRFNRYVLLTGTVICAILPGLQIQTSRPSAFQKPVKTIEQVFITPPNISEEAPAAYFSEEIITVPDTTILSPESTHYVSSDWLGIIYLSGLILTFLYLAGCWIRMWGLIRNSAPASSYGCCVRVSRHQKSSFSWGKYILLSENDYLSQSREVLLHEIMHIRCKHTYDLLWIQIIWIFQWFNPTIWLLRKELQALHEYEADERVIQSGIDATTYQLLLVKRAVGTRLYSMASGFSQSKLKNRISMMLTEKTNQWARLRLLLFLPALIGIMYVFAQPADEVQKAETGISQTSYEGQLSLTETWARTKKAYEHATYGRILSEKERNLDQSLRVFMNSRNQILFDNELVSYTQFTEKARNRIIQGLEESRSRTGTYQPQTVLFVWDRSTNLWEVEKVLQLFRNISDEAQTTVTKESLPDSSFVASHPVVLYLNHGRRTVTTGDPEVKAEIIIYGENHDILEELSNLRISELQQKVAAWRTEKDPDQPLTITLKVDKDADSGVAEDIKNTISSLFTTDYYYTHP